jgi:hypothetical protein
MIVVCFIVILAVPFAYLMMFVFSRALLGLCHPNDASVVDLSSMVDLSGHSLACVESEQSTSFSANKYCFSVTHCPSQKVCV